MGAHKAIPRFRKITDALVAIKLGHLPRGTKLVIGSTASRVVKRTAQTQEVFFEYKGTPAQFAKLLLNTTTSYGVKVEIETDDEEVATFSLG